MENLKLMATFHRDSAGIMMPVLGADLDILDNEIQLDFIVLDWVEQRESGPLFRLSPKDAYSLGLLLMESGRSAGCCG